MRIQKLKLKNFKRFSDLTIDNIPNEAKLVLLIGSNGSGKSSVFDAFSFLVNTAKGSRQEQPSYYFKNNFSSEIDVYLTNGSEIKTSGFRFVGDRILMNSFIGRSSIRIVPRILNHGTLDALENDSDRPSTFIDADSRFYSDLVMYMQQVDNALREPVFTGKSADTLKIFQDQIQPLKFATTARELN